MAEESWRDTLPDDIKADPSLADIADVPNLAKSFINAQKLIGADKIPLPGENATAEDWSNVFTKLGKPASADDYSVTMPEQMPEGFKPDEEFQKGFLAEAHKLNLTGTQAAGMARWLVDTDIQGFNDLTRDDQLALADGEKALRTEWGSAYDQRLAGTRALLSTFGDGNLKALIDTAGLGSNPAFIKFLGNVASKMGEDTLKGSGFSEFVTMTPEQAKAEISRLQADKGFLTQYQHKDPAIRKTAIEKMASLNALAFPEAPK